jgi:hypothetical protein
MNYSKLNEVYTSMLYEDVNCLNDSQDKKENTEVDDLSNIDELTEENTTTIEENTDEDQFEDSDITSEGEESSDESTGETSEDEEDGWRNDIVELCDELTYQFDGFAYELKNCVRGSFTDANTPDELANYLENLKAEIESVVNQLREM